MVDVFSTIAGIFKPASDLIDKITTTDEERMEAENKFLQIQNNVNMKILELESKLLESKTNIIVSESKGESWLQRNWRPCVMLTLTTLVVLHWVGLTPENLSETEIKELLDIVELGLGGYVIGRSGEKLVKNSKWGK